MIIYSKKTGMYYRGLFRFFIGAMSPSLWCYAGKRPEKTKIWISENAFMKDQRMDGESE